LNCHDTTLLLDRAKGSTGTLEADIDLQLLLEEGTAASCILDTAQSKVVLASLIQGRGLDLVSSIRDVVNTVRLSFAIMDNLPFQVEWGVSIQIYLLLNLFVKTSTNTSRD
jgi:hypothetical protein